MSTPLIDFESSRSRDQQLLQAKQARKAMLEKVRAQHDAKRRHLEAAKKQGEDSWMLPSVEKSLLKQGEKQPKKKSKKEKKNKRKKKKKSKKDSSTSSDSSSETEWVEKTATSAVPAQDTASEDSSLAASQSSAKSPEVQKPSRDDWMEMPSLFGTYTRDELRQREGGSRVLAKQLEKKKARDPDKPGSHALELNPYFKDGGSGLPHCASGADERRTGGSAPLVGFGASAAWLKKSLQRAKEQAAEENVALEEVAEKRWGSLDKFYELLREAEARDAAAEARPGVMQRPRADGWLSAPRCSSSDTRDTRRQENYSDNGSKDSRSRRESPNRRRSRSLNRRTRSSSSSNSRSRSRSRSRKRHRPEKQQSRKRKEPSSSSRSRSRSPTRSEKDIGKRSSRKRYKSSSESENDRKAQRRDLKKSSESKERRGSRRRHSSSYSSSSSEDDRVSRKYSKFSSPPVHHGGNRSDEERHPARRLLKPGESERSSHTLDGRQEHAVWENTRRLPSSAAPPRDGWRKKVPAQHTPAHPQAERDETSRTGQGDTGDHTEPKCAERKSPEHAPATSPVHAMSPAGEITKVESKPKRVYTTHELNQIGAKIVKAELVGNEALAAKLKKKLENARKETEEALAAGSQIDGESVGKVEETVLLTTTNSKGFTRPVTSLESEQSSSKRTKKAKTSAVGADGSRDKYFPDDHKFSLKQMFEQEKQGGTADSDAMFVRAAARSQKASLDDDYTLDDSFVDKSALREDRAGQDSRDRMKAIMDHQRREQALASCNFCCDSTHMKKHLIISLSSKSYLSLPSHESLIEGHCLIVPRDHLATSTLIDEDAWLEMTDYRKSLVRFFNSRNEDVVFLECCMHLRRQPHTVVHCLPLPRELGDLAPIYFKKAIQESESEWNQNVKLVELKGRDVRRAIPRGFPYFAVDFGTSPGYAHVIEDEASFPRHFGQSVVGGMLDVETHLWRKPKPENFDQQRRKVLAFAKEYEPFDPVQEA